MATQTVILKADDIRYDAAHTISPRWQTFIDFIEERAISAGLGLIGNSLEDAPESFCDRIRELHDSPRFEIWHHGYDHLLNKPDENGEIVCEFRGTSRQHQRDHLQRTQQLAKDRLDITLRTFGAPGNAIDGNTTHALDEVAEIAVWLYGDADSSKHVLGRTINVEYPVHNPDSSEFTRHYDATIELLVLQLHPNSWDEGRFENFASIVNSLCGHGATFATPVDWLKSQGGVSRV